MVDKVKERLASLGYTLKESDEVLINICVSKAENRVKTDCNISEIPGGLEPFTVDIAVGEFLLAKKTFAPLDISGIDISSSTIKQIQIGDTSTTFAVGQGNLTAEQRLDAYIDHLLNYGKDLFSAYRKIRW